MRGIREQAEREQDGETQADEADHLVESLVVRRCKDPHDDFPFLPWSECAEVDRSPPLGTLPENGTKAQANRLAGTPLHGVQRLS